MNRIKLYLTNLWLALRGRPIVETITKREIVSIPFSREQVNELKRIFPLKRIGSTSTRDLLINEGQLQVVDFIESWGERSTHGTGARSRPRRSL